jgi:hypothetical protein
MMGAMTVEEKVRAAQHGRVFPNEAAKRIASLKAILFQDLMQSRDRLCL